MIIRGHPHILHNLYALHAPCALTWLVPSHLASLSRRCGRRFFCSPLPVCSPSAMRMRSNPICWSFDSGREVVEDTPQLDRGRGRDDFERSAVARPTEACRIEKGLEVRHGVIKNANDDSEPAGIKATRHVTASAALIRLIRIFSKRGRNGSTSRALEKSDPRAIHVVVG